MTNFYSMALVAIQEVAMVSMRDSWGATEWLPEMIMLAFHLRM
jgi:hypothetical protein